MFLKNYKSFLSGFWIANPEERQFKLMHKDIHIINLIALLKTKLDFSLIEIIDYWKSDLCAIGIKKENKMVYFSTFNNDHSNLHPFKYDMDFEILQLEKYNVIKEFREISEDEMISEIRFFFEI